MNGSISNSKQIEQFNCERIAVRCVFNLRSFLRFLCNLRFSDDFSGRVLVLFACASAVLVFAVGVASMAFTVKKKLAPQPPLFSRMRFVIGKL
jgi:hypothetical protein